MTNDSQRLTELNLRYANIFKWSDNPFSVDIIGAGSIGSNLALLLARLGVEKITVYDDDLVEEHNLGHQAFRVKDIGKPKVEALAEIIEEATGMKIKAVNSFVDSTECEFLILAVDSMEARKNIFTQSKFNFFIDGRMGGETFNIYAGSTFDEEKYLATLYTDEEASEAPCGGRSIGYVSYMISALMEVAIKKLMKGEECPFEQNFCAKTLIYDRSPDEKREASNLAQPLVTEGELMEQTLTDTIANAERRAFRRRGVSEEIF